ncbi:haloacid dehalogenase type II [Methylobacterium sp. 092160098-2]|uniref:haloacid dehalogenase type II n=1 Tax=Methylobacterium sp. 092160098-2 TaxID=3025129 RepID=UPI0023819DF6|nr:haloacid dehalogenase type II [Methylobacterium sp. 092160098-2]MDE4915170.1 haloacid dehalogenase type II [Methylobacterium sp. 092160098-2]
MNEKDLPVMGRRGLIASLGTAAAGELIVSVTPSVAAAPTVTEGKPIQERAPSILVFDINETTLDIDHTAPVFQRVFGDKAVLREWFAQLVLYSNAITLAGPYATFFELGVGVLKMLADIHRVSLKPSDIDELRNRFQTMPPHPDVVQGLTELKGQGFRLIAFTNSPPVKPTPAENAGLYKFFEREFSIDRVRRFKPAAQCYHMVAEELGVEMADCGMVAAHVWDTLGAQAAGFSGGALITRGVNAPLRVANIPQPQIVVPDFVALAAETAKVWRQ